MCFAHLYVSWENLPTHPDEYRYQLPFLMHLPQKVPTVYIPWHIGRIWNILQAFCSASSAPDCDHSWCSTWLRCIPGKVLRYLYFQSSLKALTPWSLAGFLYHCKRQYISVLEAGLFFHGRSSDYYLQHTLHITGRNRYIIFSTIKEFIYDIWFDFLHTPI